MVGVGVEVDAGWGGVTEGVVSAAAPGRGKYCGMKSRRLYPEICTNPATTLTTIAMALMNPHSFFGARRSR
jgi:hypothetical protein